MMQGRWILVAQAWRQTWRC